MERDREDPALTATDEPSAPGSPAEPVDVVLGRYQIEREIGSGAMGVVYGAFDPELERRIALKVLRTATESREAKDRLLREARALARLTHPNVVTVYEVGTADGRDFVTMELIDGLTLAEWSRSTRRQPAEIIDAFLAAGRGLAAAHAAGIVHRDFKPTNVLCSRDRRIVVTDFGLAREADRDVPATSNTASPAEVPGVLAKVTNTGVLIGTPSYMAPEQWTAGAITPATDQFAFCVSLWEALSGQRPYIGSSPEELRSQVTRGPVSLDMSRIPRGLRQLLRRGLDPIPTKRWPTMNHVLAQLGRARRRPAIVAAVAAAVGMAAIVFVVAIAARDASATACEPPERDPGDAWSEDIAAATRASTSQAHVATLDAAFRDWQATRTKACTAPSKVRLEQLQCLDGALQRFRVLRLAYMQVPEATAEALRAQIVDPEICRQPAPADVPQLTLRASPRVVAAYKLLARSETTHKPSDSEIIEEAGALTASPCTRAIASLAFSIASTDVPRARSLMTSALGAAEQCGDDRLRADVRIRDVLYRSETPFIAHRGEAAILQAESAAQRVMQPELAAALALYRAVMAHQRGQWDDALGWVEDQLTAYRVRGLQARQIEAVIMRNYLRLRKAEPSDLTAIAADVKTWRSVAAASDNAELGRQLEVLAAQAAFLLGDVGAAHPELIRLWHGQPSGTRPRRVRRIVGEVVDAVGHPIAGAEVAAASWLVADSMGIVPRLDSLEDFVDPDLRTTTSDARGRFTIDDAALAGAIVAQLGDHRSAPVAIAGGVKLVLAATRRVSGKVILGDTLHTHAHIECTSAGDVTGRFALLAPLAPDGSFTVSGAPMTALRLGIVVRGVSEYDERIDYHNVPASPSTISGIRFDVPASNRTIDVIVRSAVTTPVEGARVMLIAGKHSLNTVRDLLRLQPSSIQNSPALPVDARLHKAVRDRTRPDDLIAHFEHAVSGDLTACAMPFGDVADPIARRLRNDHIAQVEITCKWRSPGIDIVELEMAPQKRFD